MKPLIITFLAASVFAVACKPSAEQDRKATPEQFNTVKTENQEAAQDMKDYAFVQKA